MLYQVDHLDGVAPFEMLVAQLLEVAECRHRFRRLAGDVQAQLPEVAVDHLGDGRLLAGSGAHDDAPVAAPTLTPWLVKRSGRVSSECAMPRDFSTEIVLRRPLSYSPERTAIQLSTIDETAVSPLSRSVPPGVR